MTPIDPSRTLFLGIGKSAPAWYRAALPAMHLGAEWAGVRGTPPELAFVTGLSTRALDVDELFGYEAIVVQQPRGGAWLKLIRRLQAAGVVVLYEIDDDVHAVGKHAGHLYRAHYSKAALRDMELNMRAADGLIVSTDFLAQRYRSLNGNVWVCRNGLDLGRYNVTPPRGGDTVTIGWAGGTGHREAMVPWLNAVGRVMAARANVRFMSVGEPFASVIEPQFGPQRALSLPFSELESYPCAMANFDIALAPATNTNFYRAKSDLRWLEASALSTPAIADPLVYDEIAHGVTGFHASTSEEAEQHLLRLVDDADERLRVGAAAREHLLAHRTMATMAPQWATALAEAGELRELREAS
ncbi:MAG TPA: glycosyltransferase [Solirubrobacteraceae bacterium]|jgi:glycosyltransferase involved in cell wall biosynthesis|nr:glycosyltransferase [Solirubrobacteraceae bacterium]